MSTCNNLVDVKNDLTSKQKKELSDKIEKLQSKYSMLAQHENIYFLGVIDGLNHAYKLINEINDDYNFND